MNKNSLIGGANLMSVTGPPRDCRALLVLLLKQSHIMQVEGVNPHLDVREWQTKVNLFLRQLASAQLDVMVLGYADRDGTLITGSLLPTEAAPDGFLSSLRLGDHLPLNLVSGLVPGPEFPTESEPRSISSEPRSISEWVAKWTTTNASDENSPLVLHIAEGVSADEPVLREFNKVSADHQNAVFMHCLFATSGSESATEFPNPSEILANGDAVLMTWGACCSTLPNWLAQEIGVQRNGRALAINADANSLSRMLDVARSWLDSFATNLDGGDAQASFPAQLNQPASTDGPVLSPEGPSVPRSELRADSRDGSEVDSVAADVTVELDENVQFTIYRPNSVRPQKWYRLLAFAHLDELPDDADKDELDPVEAVKREAEKVLGPQVRQYKQTVQDSSHAVPRAGELRFIPEVEGCEFNPPQQSIRWIENVHKAEFRMRADESLDGKSARGRMSVFLGAILLADIPLRIKVDSAHVDAVDEQPTEAATAKPYRKIFASYSHKDLAIVEQFEHYAETLGDRYLRDWKELRSGENWDERLLGMIEEADVFQLFWSSNSMRSPFVRREWEHAMSLINKGPYFVRPTYWETPLPEIPEDNLPPSELQRRHFTCLAAAAAGPHANVAVATEQTRNDTSMNPDNAPIDDAVDPDPDLAVPDEDSSISLEADSGISLLGLSDSGLSLDEESIDEADEAPMADDDFTLPPSDSDLFDDDEDSGSQVIEVEDSEAFGDEDFALDEDVLFDAEPRVFEEYASPSASYSAAAPAARSSPLAHKLLAVISVAAVGIFFVVAGLMFFSGPSQEEIDRHVGQIKSLVEQGDYDGARSYYDKLKAEAPEVALLPELIAAKNEIDGRAQEQDAAFEEQVTRIRESNRFEIESSDISNARKLARSPEQVAIIDSLEKNATEYRQANQSIVRSLLEKIDSPAEFQRIMHDFVQRYPESPRVDDFRRVLANDIEPLNALVQWNTLVDQVFGIDIVQATPDQTLQWKTQLDSLDSAFAQFPNATIVQSRVAASQAIARRGLDGKESLSGELIRQFEQPVANIKFVFATKSGQHYFLPEAPTRSDKSFQIRFALDPSLSLDAIAIPLTELDAALSGKQSNRQLADACKQRLAVTNNEYWESTYAFVIQSIHSAKQLDPILKTLWLRDAIRNGSQGSHPLASAFSQHRRQLEQAEVSDDVNWLDTSDPSVTALRSRCQQLLQKLPDVATAGQLAVEQARALSRQASSGARLRQIGLLFRDDTDSWRCELSNDRLSGDVFVLLRQPDSAEFTPTKIGELDAGVIQFDPGNVTESVQGRPVYAFTKQHEI